MTWNEFVIKCKNALRYFLRTYKREIKRYVNGLVDEAVAELQIHVNMAVSNKIKNEVIVFIIANQIDIHSKIGAETVKIMISDFIDKLEGGL